MRVRSGDGPPGPPVASLQLCGPERPHACPEVTSQSVRWGPGTPLLVCGHDAVRCGCHAGGRLRCGGSGGGSMRGALEAGVVT